MFIKSIRQLIVAVIVLASHGAAAQSLERLLDAVERGEAKEVAAYLDQGLDPNSTGPQGHTILMAASRLGHVEMVRLLLARKANPNRQAPTGDTAIMMASLGGHVAVVKLLADNGARVASPGGWNALHYAAYGGSAEVVQYLLAHGADKNGLAPNWDTPLLLATRNGQLAAAKVLLQDAVDLAHRSKNGETALAVARAKGHTALIDLLRRAGAPE
jgi:ankyrin repeat protein